MMLGSSSADADWNVATASRPASPRRSRSRRSSIWSTRARVLRAYSRTSRPAGVSSAARGPFGRSNSVVPAAFSSWAICWLTADCVNPSASAALAKVPWSTTATSAARWRLSASRSVGISISISDDNEQKELLLVMSIRSYPRSHGTDHRSRTRRTRRHGRLRRTEGRADRAVPHGSSARRERRARRRSPPTTPSPVAVRERALGRIVVQLARTAA